MKRWVAILLFVCTISVAQSRLDKSYAVVIVPADSIGMVSPYSDQAKRDSIFRQYNNRHAAARALEQYLLNQSNAGIIIRNTDGRLELPLSNGTVMTMVPNPSTEEADYTFVHYYEELNLVLFRVQWSEGNNYALVNVTDGRKTYILGQPHFSPDKKFMMAINCDIEAGYSGNGFELFEVKDGNLRKTWEYNPPDWGPVALTWVDNSTAVSMNNHLDRNDYTTKRAYTRLSVKEIPPSDEDDCLCPLEGYSETGKPQRIFGLSNGEAFAICGHSEEREKGTLFSEFTVSLCGQERAIRFWDALQQCYIHLRGDTLVVEQIMTLPTPTFNYEPHVWIRTRIYLENGIPVLQSAVNKQLPRYDARLINDVIKEYEQSSGELNDDKMVLAKRLFIAAISGSHTARHYFAEFEKKFGELDGAFSEEYRDLKAMLRLWERD